VIAAKCGLDKKAPLIVSQHYPIFISLQCTLCLALWAFGTLGTGEELAGLETLFPGGTDLCLQYDCVDYRAQMAWRWFTHQFSHVGISHVVNNCLLAFLLGFSLEGFHGTFLMFFMFNAGVFGGACCYMISDVHTRVVGMSGGCYALFGMHFGDTLMNWSEKRKAAKKWDALTFEQKQERTAKWRKIVIDPRLKLVVLVIMFIIDLVQFYFTMGGATSHSVHLGGALAGCAICIVFGRNLVVKDYEVYLQHGICAIGVAVVIFCIAWGMSWPPRDIFDTTPWCWGRQVANSTIFKDNAWHCIRCADQACITRWSAQRHIERVTDRVCRRNLGWEISER